LIINGSLFLWLGWFFFNGISGKSITHAKTQGLPSMIIMNTILSGSAGALIVFFFKPFFMRKISPLNNYNPISLCNGLLAGLVAITAPCNNVYPWAALAIGVISGLQYIFSCWILAKLKIDDPVDAV
jgi:Amt family ammonium transporter